MAPPVNLVLLSLTADILSETMRFFIKSAGTIKQTNQSQKH